MTRRDGFGELVTSVVCSRCGGCSCAYNDVNEVDHTGKNAHKAFEMDTGHGLDCQGLTEIHYWRQEPLCSNCYEIRRRYAATQI